MSVCIEPGNDTESFRRTEEALCQSRDEWKHLAIAYANAFHEAVDLADTAIALVRTASSRSGDVCPACGFIRGSVEE